MQIKYEEGVDGFVIALRHEGEPIAENYIDNLGRPKKRITRTGGKLIFLKFLREKDWDEFYAGKVYGGNDYDYSGYIITDPQDAAIREGVEWEEQTYVPKLTRWQLSPQQILDYKEKVRAANIKPDVLPIDPVADRNDLDNAGNIGAVNLRGFEVQEVPQPVDVPQHELRFAQPVPGEDVGDGILVAQPIYYERGNINWGVGAEAVRMLNEHLQARQPEIPAENDPNRVIPAADNPF